MSEKDRTNAKVEKYAAIALPVILTRAEIKYIGLDNDLSLTDEGLRWCVSKWQPVYADSTCLYDYDEISDLLRSEPVSYFGEVLQTETLVAGGYQSGRIKLLRFVSANEIFDMVGELEIIKMGEDDIARLLSAHPELIARIDWTGLDPVIFTIIVSACVDHAELFPVEIIDCADTILGLVFRKPALEHRLQLFRLHAPQLQRIKNVSSRSWHAWDHSRFNQAELEKVT